MLFVDQSVEVIDRNKYTAAQLIELCGRTCYKSEDRITEESADKFVHMIAKRGHLSVIEHAHFAIEVPVSFYWDFKDAGVDFTRFFNMSSFNEMFIISGNLRAWVEFVKNAEKSEFDITRELDDIKRLIYLYCKPVYDASFENSPAYKGEDYWGIFSFISYDSMSIEEREIHEPVTVKFITNRGVTHELVRHRPASYSQESTRYVNYGGQEMQFIKPVWWNDSLWNAHIEKRSRLINGKLLIFDNHPFGDGDSGSYDQKELWAMITWFQGCCSAEAKYNQLLKWGWKPEQAREVLPNSLKTEIVMTATVKEWKHVINLRTSKAAHPQIRALINPLKDIFF